MCQGNTDEFCEGKQIARLADGNRIFWPACARLKMLRHLARHRLGQNDVAFMFIDDLREEMNCVHSSTFNNIIWPKITSALKTRLGELEKAGVIEYRMGGQAMWPTWTASWFHPEWTGDIGFGRPFRGAAQGGGGEGRRKQEPWPVSQVAAWPVIGIQTKGGGDVFLSRGEETAKDTECPLQHLVARALTKEAAAAEGEDVDDWKDQDSQVSTVINTPKSEPGPVKSSYHQSIQTWAQHVRKYRRREVQDSAPIPPAPRPQSQRGLSTNTATNTRSQTTSIGLVSAAGSTRHSPTPKPRVAEPVVPNNNKPLSARMPPTPPPPPPAAAAPVPSSSSPSSPLYVVANECLNVGIELRRMSHLDHRRRRNGDTDGEWKATVHRAQELQTRADRDFPDERTLVAVILGVWSTLEGAGNKQ